MSSSESLASSLPVVPSKESLLDQVFALERRLLEQAPSRLKDCADPHGRSSISYLNHASFGDPHPSTLALRQYITNDLCYRQPMVYHRDLVPPLIQRARQRVCDFLKISKVENFHFQSVSTALFSVLESIQWQQGGVVITSDMLYHSVKDALIFLSEQYKFQWICIETPHGCNLDEMYEAFENEIQKLHTISDHKIQLVALDHISSKPSVLFPVQRICQLCRRLGIPTLVDAAHTAGTLPVSLIHVDSWGATFAAFTFHKWVNTPRGYAGGLYVDQAQVEEFFDDWIDLSRLVVHGGWSDRPMDGESANGNQLYLDHTNKPGLFTDGITQGIYDESTREYENLLVLPHCLDLVLRYEDDMQAQVQELYKYTRSTLSRLWELSEEQAATWSPDPFANNDEIFLLPMLSLPLPTEKCLAAGGLDKTTWDASALGRLKKAMVPLLWNNYAVEVPLFVWKESILGIRISFGRYVQTKDINRLGWAVLDLCKQGFEA